MELDPDFQPPKRKRKKVDLPAEDRFASVVSDTDMSVIAKGFVPSNTKNTTWAMNCFQEWMYARDKRLPAGEEQGCPKDLLEHPDVEKLNYWLSRFVAEVRNKKGEPYPPRTIHQILAGLQRYMLDKNPNAPKFLNKGEASFRDIRGTCDTVYRDLRSKGIGAEVRHAATISPEEEEKLWRSSVLSIANPKALQRAVFFYIGKCFCIRGGQEQRCLGPSNFKLIADPDCDPHCVVYVEHGSKNRPGGLKDLRVENKEVTHYAVPENAPQCLVFLLNLYMKKLPKYAFESDILYLRPKRSTPEAPDIPWYEEAPVGKTHSL